MIAYATTSPYPNMWRTLVGALAIVAIVRSVQYATKVWARWRATRHPELLARIYLSLGLIGLLVLQIVAAKDRWGQDMGYWRPQARLTVCILVLVGTGMLLGNRQRGR